MKSMTGIRWCVVVAAAALAVASYGVGAAGSSSTDAEATVASRDQSLGVPAPGHLKAPERKDVTVQGASPAPNIGYLPLYVAQKLGYFRDEGLNVQINYSHGDSAPLQALGSGQAQIMSGTPEALIRGHRRGLRAVIFYQIYDKLIYSVAVPEGGAIESPAALAGKTIGVSSMGSTGVIIAKALLKRAGVDLDSIRFLPVGTGQQALGALESGEVDALALWDAAYSQIEAAPGSPKLTHWKPKKLEHVGDGGYFTTIKLIKSEPNTLAHFTRAIAKSMVAIHADPEKALRIYWEVNPSAKPKGTDSEALQVGLEQLKVVGRSLDFSGVPKAVDVSILDTYVNTFIELGVIKKPVPVKDIATNVFVPIATQAADEARAALAGK